MAAYCQVYGVIHFTSPAGWLPVHRDQLWAQRSVTSMGKLYLLSIGVGREPVMQEKCHKEPEQVATVIAANLHGSIHRIRQVAPNAHLCLKHVSLGPRESALNDISIGSAVFAALMHAMRPKFVLRLWTEALFDRRVSVSVSVKSALRARQTAALRSSSWKTPTTITNVIARINFLTVQ